MEKLYKIPLTLFFLTGNLAFFVSNAQSTNTRARSTFPCEAAVPPSVSITTDAPNNLTICGSTQWHFDVDYTDGDLYQWKILNPAMGSIVSGNYSPNIEVLFNNPSGTSEYVEVIVAVTKCNEIKRDTLIMEVINGPEYTVTPGTTTICANEPLSFSISPTPIGYTELSWDFGDGISSDQPNPTHSYSNGENVAQYTPVATIVHPGGCLSTAVMQAGPITVKPAPVAYVSPGHMIGCGPFSTTLTATVTTGFGSTTNYAWHGPTTNPSPPNCAGCNTWDINQYGGYYVIVENSNGCRDTSITVKIIENCDDCPDPKPYLVASGSSFIDCGIVQANIQYNPNGLNIISETWVFPDEATNTSFTTGTNATATATFEKAGVYITNYLVDDGTCVQRFVQTVYVPFISDMRYTASCGSGNLYDVTLFDHSNVYPSEVGHIEHTYAYKFESDPWQTITAPSDALTVTVQLPPGNYQFREIIESNLTTGAPPCTTLVNVNLPDKPIADFQIDTPYIPACINDVVIHLDNQSTPATGIEYLWDFGEGFTNYQQNPDKVF